MKLRDTVSCTTKGASDVEFGSSRACAALFYRSLRSLTLSDDFELIGESDTREGVAKGE